MAEKDRETAMEKEKELEMPTVRFGKPEANRDGLSWFLFRSKTVSFGFSFEPAVFRWFFYGFSRFRTTVFCSSGLGFIDFRRFFAVPVWNRPEPAVSARFWFEVF